jgi:hypothetical protein
MLTVALESVFLDPGPMSMWWLTAILIPVDLGWKHGWKLCPSHFGCTDTRSCERQAMFQDAGVGDQPEEKMQTGVNQSGCLTTQSHLLPFINHSKSLQ